MTNLHRVVLVPTLLVAGCSSPSPQHDSEAKEAAVLAPRSCRVIRTTNGDIDSSQAGIILPHEHLLMDFFDFGVPVLGDPDASEDKLATFVNTTALPGVFQGATGRTLVELSTRGLREDNYGAWRCPDSNVVPPWPGAERSSPEQCQARDDFRRRLDARSYPLLLDDLATFTGAQVVMGTGAYWGHYHPIDWYDKHADGSVTYTIDEERIYSQMVADIREGVDGTNVRAGVIGEIGISEGFGQLDNPEFGSPEREHSAMDGVVLAAACLAHIETGAAINIHFPPLYPYNLENNGRAYARALDILRSKGCTEFDRIVFSHFLSTSDPGVNAKLEEIASLGINLEFDLFGTTNPGYVEDGTAVASLIEKGYVDQLLVSQDIFNPWELSGVGYAYIVENLASYFRTSRTQAGSQVISANAKVWLADVSGDGKADLVAQDPQGSSRNGSIFVALSTDNGFDMWTSVSSVRVSNTAVVWLADVNGDGRADLVAQGGAADPDHGQIYVALSNGAGFDMWGSVTSVRVSNTAVVWLADVDGDSRADLVAQGGAADPDHGQIYVALSNGTGFAMWTSVSSVRVSNTAKVWLADVNGDSRADLVAQGGAADPDHGQIYLALGTGTGFAMWTSVSSVRVSNTAKVWLADVNDDNQADLVVQGGAADPDHGQIYVALSTGTGFAMWTSVSSVRVSNTAVVRLADVNHDSKADLVVQGGAADPDHGQIYVALSTGSGFAMWTSVSSVRVSNTAVVWLADVDGDKRADLVVQGGAPDQDAGRIYLGLSQGTSFQMWTVAPARVLHDTDQVWLADVNDDRNADLVVKAGLDSQTPGQMHVGLATGSGFRMWTSISSVRVSNTAVVWLADVNGDDRSDLVVQGGAADGDHGQIYVALSTGTGFDMWTSVSSVRVSNTAVVRLADVNGDDRSDLVVQGGAADGDHGQIYVALSTGTGFAMWTSISSVRVSSTAVVWLADVNGDSKADLVAQGGPGDPDHGQIYVALSTGAGFAMWTSVSSVRVSDTANVWLLDVDGDDKADLVARGGPGDPDHGQIYVALSNVAGNGFEMWTSRTDERLDPNGRLWFQNIAGSKALEAVYLPSNGQNDFDLLRYFSHPIGVSARDMQRMMVVNARRVLEMTVPCGQ